MPPVITRTQLQTLLAGHLPEEVAGEYLRRAIEKAGLPDSPTYAPEEVALIGRTFLESAQADLAPALPELADIPGPAL